MDSVRPPPNAEPPARFWSLDALRGLCALVVFLSHWHLWSQFPPRGDREQWVQKLGTSAHHWLTELTWPTGAQHPAVIAFFVLSGFCIHYPFERRMRAGAPVPDWRAYFGKRFRRIAPVYWTACALGLVFVAAETLHPSGNPLLQLHARFSAHDAVIRFTALAGLWPREIFAGNYILTTVAIEVVMYAIYPLFFRCALRGSWLALGVAFGALHVLTLPLLQIATPYWVFNSALMLGVFWYAGALAAHWFLVRRVQLRSSWLLAAWLLFLALKATPHFYGLNYLKQAAWGLVCAFGILWSLRWEALRPAWRERAVAQALRYAGRISYSLYATHTPAIMLASWALLAAGHANYPAQLATTLAASLAVTLAVHYGIERTCYPLRE